jgi:hypothetical protein
VSFGLSPQLKTNFEQIFNAPFLVELLLVELAPEKEKDLLMRLHFDGAFQFQSGGVLVAASQRDPEAAAQGWLQDALNGKMDRTRAADLLLQAWWCLMENKSFGEGIPNEADRQAGWRALTKGREVEMGWLARKSPRAARYEPLTMAQVGL